MLHLAQSLEVATAGDQIVALRVTGQPNCAHASGIPGLLGWFRAGEDAHGFRSMPSPASWRFPWFRRVSRYRLLSGAYVLSMGRFASAHERDQQRAIDSSPAGFETWSGMFGRVRNRTPLALGEPMLPAIMRSCGYTVAAYDGHSLVVCTRSRDGQRLLDFLESELRSGELLIRPERHGFSLATLDGREAALEMASGERSPDLLFTIHKDHQAIMVA